MRRAFTRKAKQVHPDHSADPGAKAAFEQLFAAYKVLRDPQSRARYDASGTTGPEGPGHTEPPPGGRRNEGAGRSRAGSGRRSSGGSPGARAERTTRSAPSSRKRARGTQFTAVAAIAIFATVALGGLLLGAWGTIERQESQIADLTYQLRELTRKASTDQAHSRDDFFDRLNQILNEEMGAGADSLAFRSELLFAAGSTTLDAAGEAQLQRFVSALRPVLANVADDAGWRLRVDSHFAPEAEAGEPGSDWQQAAARADAVARFLIGHGVPSSYVTASAVASYGQDGPGQRPREGGRIELRFLCCL